MADITFCNFPFNKQTLSDVPVKFLYFEETVFSGGMLSKVINLTGICVRRLAHLNFTIVVHLQLTHGFSSLSNNGTHSLGRNQKFDGDLF